MRLPWTRRHAVRVDHGYKRLGEGNAAGYIAVACGPFTDRFFWRRSAADRHMNDIISSGVPAERVWRLDLGWHRTER